jgi:very-short-patch-repair endonuclease
MRLAIEIDGETHTSADVAAHDETRSNYFQSHGYRVLRFGNSEAMNNTESVMNLIQQAVAEQELQHPPPLTPPHASRGRGTL